MMREGYYQEECERLEKELKRIYDKGYIFLNDFPKLKKALKQTHSLNHCWSYDKVIKLQAFLDNEYTPWGDCWEKYTCLFIPLETEFDKEVLDLYGEQGLEEVEGVGWIVNIKRGTADQEIIKKAFTGNIGEYNE